MEGVVLSVLIVFLKYVQYAKVVSIAMMWLVDQLIVPLIALSLSPGRGK